MNRYKAIKNIMDKVKEDDIVVTSTGLISRETYHYMDRDLNFYMMGSMGCALGIGIGIALNTYKKVIVINGDGSALMSLGTMVLLRDLRDKSGIYNLEHIIIDNNKHESTGGQRTVSRALSFAYIDNYTKVKHCLSDSDIPPRIPLKPYEITERFTRAFQRISNK